MSRLNEFLQNSNKRVLKFALIGFSVIILVKASCTDFGSCCPGRNNSCNSTTRGRICFCDEFCTKSTDCCGDYEYYCRKQDCVMNYWSHWVACSAQCAKGVQFRTRTVHIPSASGGKPCGKKKQTRACYDTGPHCARKEVAQLLPTYYNPWRNRPSKYFDPKPKRDSYCVRYYLTYVSPYCAHDTPWYIMKQANVVCVECHERAMDEGGRCQGSLPGTSDSWHGIATHNCFGTWIAASNVTEKCTCGHNHGYDFIFV